MFILPTFVLLVLLSACTSVESKAAKISFACKKSGYACKSCNQTMLCVDNGTKFNQVLIQTCGKCSTCVDGACSTVPNPTCNYHKKIYPRFVCNTPGAYPDPFDCTKYYFCVKSTEKKTQLKIFTAKCNPGFRFNMNNTVCNIPMVKQSCGNSYPLVKCKIFGKTDAFKNNPMYYYVCQYHPDYPTVLYPFMYACDNGKTYNPNTYSCS